VTAKTNLQAGHGCSPHAFFLLGLFPQSPKIKDFIFELLHPPRAFSVGSKKVRASVAVNHAPFSKQGGLLYFRVPCVLRVAPVQLCFRFNLYLPVKETPFFGITGYTFRSFHRCFIGDFSEHFPS